MAFNSNTILVDVMLDPWIFWFGVGFRFGR